ncbi:hypothetical protein BBO_07523 [Beauveria brongniartii RCEF 3172]|uniref:Integral membrane protein n=1 Tax=Beauveria brongniartii RCEF 3172 TaxID=1081107 RepID=A0A166ZDP1_9HYPO|nr:hypothetical protein BBO_07523 [Beauveria brongniartii RCEF 3172]
MKEIQGPWLASCMGIFFGWAFLAWLVRVWAKLRTHVWTLDDHAICGSMRDKSTDGKSHRPMTIKAETDQLQNLVSAALFIAYISNSGPHIQPAQSLAVVTALWTASSLLAICIRGDIAQPWKVLDGSYIMFRRWLGIEVSGIFIELVLWGMAAHLVWGIQLKTSKRILVICAFGARLLVVVLVAVRLVFLDPRVNTGPARGATIADFLTEACVHLSIIAGSATTLKPLLMSFYPAHMEPAEASTFGTRSKQRTRARDIDYRLERTKPAILTIGHRTCDRISIHRAAVSDITWRPMGQGTLNTPAPPVVESGNENGTGAARSSTRLHKNSGVEARQWDAIPGTIRSGGAPRTPPGSSTSDDSGRIMIQKPEVMEEECVR